MSHQKRRGHLKIYLGYAAGVGKTYQMLEDARELKTRGVDVVLGFLEAQGRNDVIERSKEFETIPLLRVACRGSYTEEIDVVGILQRHRRCALWTIWHIRMRPDRNGSGVGRTCRFCSTAAWTCLLR